MGCSQGKELGSHLPKPSDFRKNAANQLVADKIKALQNVELFILDNSVRETTVAQIRGHTLANKYSIMDLVYKSTGITHQLVAVFGSLPTVDDIFAKQLQDEVTTRYPGQHLYAFCEVRDEVINGIPSGAIPIGMRAIVNMEMYCGLFFSRVTWIREHCSPDSLIFVNIRDFNQAWLDEPKRIQYFILFLSKLATQERIFGICLEDPSGTVYPFIMGYQIRMTKEIMLSHGWETGHLLVHTHYAFGLAEATVLEALMEGATGIWCGVCRDGAASGHSNSLTTVCNLHRIGNTYVQQQYNAAAIRIAAIEITKIVTGAVPHPTTELYGSRALDICFDSSMGGDNSELLAMLEILPRTRISSLATPSMFAQAMTEYFGTYEWEDTQCEKMLKLLHQDLKTNRKEEYNSLIGLASLYERSGGVIMDQIQAVIAQDEEMNTHPLVQRLHNYCMEWRSCRRADEQRITYLQFYDGFLAQFLNCYHCSTTREALQILDLDKNGYISWDELVFRAKWVIKEYPDHCHSIEDTIACLCEKYLMPEIAQALRATSSNRSFTSSHTSMKLLDVPDVHDVELEMEPIPVITSPRNMSASTRDVSLSFVVEKKKEKK